MLGWFPGHMNKARRQIKDALPEIDVVIEVLDRLAQLGLSERERRAAAGRGKGGIKRRSSRMQLAQAIDNGGRGRSNTVYTHQRLGRLGQGPFGQKTLHADKALVLQ